VLRFWNNDVLTNIASVMQVIEKNLPSPRPSPARREPLSPALSRQGEREIKRKSKQWRY